MKHQIIRITGIFGFLLLAVAATAGTWSANKFFYQPALDARGSTEKNNFDTGLTRVDKHLANEKILGDPNYSTLAEALATIGSNKVTLTIPAGTVAITSNNTIGNNIVLKILNGGMFSVNAGVTLTINGPIDAGPYQIFSGSGTITLGGVSTIYDVWYATPPSTPQGNIASPVGSRFVKTTGSAPILYNKESGAGTSGWVASSGGSGATAFTGLNDVPNSYSGQGGKAVRVNTGGTGLEFYIPSSGGASIFTGLTDVPSSYTGQSGKALRVNSGTNGLEFYSPFSGLFTALTDAPGSYSGQAGKAVRVNSTANGLEFFTLPSSGATAFNGLSDVPNSYTGQTGKALRVNPSANGLEYYTPFSGAFTGLADAPVSYSGQAGKAVRVNSTANGLEFFTVPSSGATAFNGLSDVPNSYTGQTGKALRVNPSANGLEYYTPFSGAFTGLADAPVSYSGQSGKSVRVNATANGLEFFNLPPSGATAFNGLSDVPSSYTGQAGKALRVKSDTSGLEFYAPLSTFTALADVPSSYTGQIGKCLRVNSSGTGLEFYTPSSGGSTSFTGLTDVPSSYSGQTGKALRVNANANGLEFYSPSSSGGVQPFNTLGDPNCTSLSQALATIGSTPTTLVIPAEAGAVAITSNTTIPANVDLMIFQGARLDVATGVTLTINSSIEAGPYQIFSWSGSGKVDISKSPNKTCSLAWWGITWCPQGGPYTGDISPALLAAIAAVNSGQTITIPAGRFRLATPTTILRSWAQFHIQGVSVWDTQIYVDVGSGNVGLTIGQVGGDSALHTQNLKISGLSFVGPNNCCKNALRIIETHNTALDDVNFWCGSTSYALSVEGSLFVTGYVQIRGGTDNYGSFSTPHDGINIASSSTPYQSNVVDLRVGVHQATGVGVFVDGTNYHSAITRLTGSIENCGSYPLHLYNQTLVDISNLYTEGNNALNMLVDKCNTVQFNTLLSNSAGFGLSLVNSHNVILNNCELTGLNINAGCRGVIVRGTSVDATQVIDNAPDTDWSGQSSQTAYDHGSQKSKDKVNLWYNTSFNRWQSDQPDGGWGTGNTAWTKSGIGISSPNDIHHLSPYCAKATTNGGSGAWTINLDAAQLSRVRGQVITHSLWEYFPVGETLDDGVSASYVRPFTWSIANTVPTWASGSYKVNDAVIPTAAWRTAHPAYIDNSVNGNMWVCTVAGTTGATEPTWGTGMVDAGSDAVVTDGGVTWVVKPLNVDIWHANPYRATMQGTWHQDALHIFVPNNATAVAFSYSLVRQPSGTEATCYIAEPTLMVSNQTPTALVESASEFQGFIQIGANRDYRGQAYIPTSSSSPLYQYYALRGDVAWGLPSAGNTSPGWVCITSGNNNGSGTAAVWKAMGNLAN